MRLAHIQTQLCVNVFGQVQDFYSGLTGWVMHRYADTPGEAEIMVTHTVFNRVDFCLSTNKKQAETQTNKYH